MLYSLRSMMKKKGAAPTAPPNGKEGVVSWLDR
jgi:hypothetical protein